MVSKIKCSCKGTHYVIDGDWAYYLQRDVGGDFHLMNCPVTDDNTLVYEQTEMIVENPEQPEDDEYVTIIAQLLEIEV